MAKQLKEIEIPFGAKDSELCGWEYTIPEGMEATIVDNKIVVKKKESEDEKIRKELIKIVNDHYSLFKEIDRAKTIAWLEKQGSEPNWCHHKVDLSDCSEEYRKAYYDGWNNCNQQHAQLEAEQKPANKVESKFKVGDVVTNKKSKDTVKIVQILHDSYCYSGWDGAATVHSDFSISEQDDWELVQQTPAWSEEVENWFKEIELMCLNFSNDTDYREKFFTWLKSIKDKVLPQPKQEWSDEDEKMLGYAIKAVYTMYVGKHHSSVTDVYVKTSNWLKSLRPQNTWKPSEYELKVLKLAAEKDGACLMGLYQQLKKLKGE